jgi:hypothetical protein
MMRTDTKGIKFSSLAGSLLFRATVGLLTDGNIRKKILHTSTIPQPEALAFFYLQLNYLYPDIPPPSMK